MITAVACARATRADQDELIERWTLVGDELTRARGKREVNALAFALLWKFFLRHGRFPRERAELPDESGRVRRWSGQGCGC